MINFLIYYSLIGFILSIILNITLWALHRPILSAMEIIGCIILWPTTINSIINSFNGVEEDLGED
tara:strand:+ start:1016 stop:1210 length:195 start_codon:yes stop_codon:yes gene_type:complete